MNEDWVDILSQCRHALGECAETLMQIQQSAAYDIVESVELHQLHDMAEDAAETGRIRRAETDLAWRLFR